FEPRLSLTGARADQRVRVAPGELGLVMTQLAARLAARAGIPLDTAGIEAAPVDAGFLGQLAERLWPARGRSLVVCGSQDVPTQVLCNFVNHVLGNYGAAVDLEHPSYQRQGGAGEMETLLRELRDGRVAALLVLDSNPVFDLPDAEALAAA